MCGEGSEAGEGEKELKGDDDTGEKVRARVLKRLACLEVRVRPVYGRTVSPASWYKAAAKKSM